MAMHIIPQPRAYPLWRPFPRIAQSVRAFPLYQPPYDNHQSL